MRAGVAFDPVRDVVYAADEINDELVAFSTDSFTELFRTAIGEDIGDSGAFPPTAMTVSDDGRFVFLGTPEGVRMFSVELPFEFLLGDVDNNGDVDADDIDRLYSEFGTPTSLAAADLDKDNDVDEEDARLWVHDGAGTDFGDADLNKVIDLIDFGHLAGGFGGDGGWADGNFDGFLGVNILDFGLLADNFGKDFTVSESTVTPEPGTSVLFGLACLVLLHRRQNLDSPPRGR